MFEQERIRFHFGLSTKEKIVAAITSPVWIPIVIGKKIIDKIKKK